MYEIEKTRVSIRLMTPLLDIKKKASKERMKNRLKGNMQIWTLFGLKFVSRCTDKRNTNVIGL